MCPLFYNNERLSSNADRQFHEKILSLRPDVKGEKQFFTQLLERLRHKIQRHGLPFNQATFQLAGSLEKNTMLSSHREFDIIVTLPNLRDYPATRETKDALRETIAEILEDYDPDVPRNGYNVKITLSDVSVDILPTFQTTLDRFLALSPSERVPYKGHMSLNHITFMQDRGLLFQECCRLIKYWAHGPSHENRPHYASSWFLELITAGSYPFAWKQTYCAIFEMILRRIKNIKKRKRRRSKFFAFDDFYELTPAFREQCVSQLTVLEPTDPADNLAIRGYQAKRLGDLVKKSRDTLKLWGEAGFNSVFQRYFSRSPV